MSLVFEYPTWFILLCIALGAGYAWLLYHKDRLLESVAPWLIYTMAAFRFLVVTIIAILLLSPLLKTNFREVEKPIVVLAQDNSESVIINKDSAFYQHEYLDAYHKLQSELADKYDLTSFTFSDDAKISNQIDFSGKQTDISAMFDELDNLYNNRNVGAVIIASDGLYNKGKNPLYRAAKLKFPVYTIALGDTSVRKDIILTKINHNRYAYLGNTFPLEVVVDAHQCKDKKTKLTVSDNDGVQFEKEINITGNQFNTAVPVLLEAKKVGLQKYHVQLSSIEGEISTSNNQADVFIEVLDGRQKVLILADAPHPDIGALKRAIEVNDNYEVEVKLIDDWDKQLSAYNLVIFHQLPSTKAASRNLMLEWKASDVPALFIVGQETDLGQFNKLETGLKIETGRSNINEVIAVPDQNYSLFTISDKLRNSFQHFPPLVAPYGDYKVSGLAHTMLKQKIGLVETDKPLLLFSEQGERKVGVLAGEGIWKWALNDYAVNNSHEVFDELISKLVQYLSVKTDKSLFRVMGKNHFFENEPILFDAELYNESYELINEPEVNIRITNSEGKTYPFVFSRTANAYRLNAGNLPVGDYTYEATVKSGEKVYSEKGAFSVSALQIESTNTVANHQLMYSLAQQTGGKMYYPNHLEDLAKDISNREDIKPIIYNHKKLDDVIHQKWIFFLILALVALEWFLRKRNGAY